jgi:WD40 repeat protein/tRNA A-37 threonylcarbamoyl transferase component Bud32
MLSDAQAVSELEQRLQEAILSYLKAADSGKPLHPQALLTQYPDLTEELANFFSDQSHLDPLLAPLRGLRPATSLAAEDGPRTIGNYELLAVIGQGGMGIVYKARQKSPRRLVALKMIRVGALATMDDLRRFRNEAEAVATLDHPHIVPVYEVGEHAGQPYFTMKLLDGGSLDQQLARYRTDPKAAARLVATVARAVHHAHQRGVLHRDLKPSNILLSAHEQPHVSDFGLAKRLQADVNATQTGAIVGSPSYMAPEQAAGDKGAVSTATDVYGLGAVLYALLAGQPPFRGDNILSTLEQVRSREPDSPSGFNCRVDRDLECICLKCLEKEPRRRYPSAEALADDLKRWLGGEAVQARRIGQLARFGRWSKRNPLVAGLLMALAFLILVATLGQSITLALVWTEKEATKLQQSLTETALAQARQERYAARLQAYVARMNQAHGLLTGADPGRARALLTEDIPAEEEEDLRGFEWYYLWGLLERPTVPLATLSKHRGDVYSVAFSPDGKLLASAGKDKIIWLWDTATRQPRAKLEGHNEEINCVTFSMDGRLLASASEDGTIRLWDIPEGRSRPPLVKATCEAASLAFSADGKMLAAGFNDGTILRWELPSFTRHLPDRCLFQRIEDLAFSPDSKTIAVATEVGGILLDSTTGLDRMPGRFLPVATLRAVAFAHNGRTLAGTGGGAAVHLADAGTLQQFLVLHGNPEVRESVAFSPDDRFLATADKGGMIHIWDLHTSKVWRVIHGHADRAWSVAFSPDGRTLATSGSDGPVRLWDLSQPQDRQVLGQRVDTACYGYQVARDSKTLAFLDGPPNSMIAHFWDLAGGKRIRSIPLAARIIGFACSDDGRTLAAGGIDGTITIWDVNKGQKRLVWTVPQARCVDQIAFLEHSRLLVTSSRGGEIILWDVLTGESRRTLTPTGNCSVFSVAPGGRTMAVRVHLPKPHVRLADTTTGQLAGPVLSAPHGAICCAISHDNELVAMGLGDFSIQLADSQSGAIRARLLGHRALVRSLTFSPDGKTLASGSDDGTARLWNVATGRELFTLIDGAGIVVVEFTPDGRALVTNIGDTGYQLALWRRGEFAGLGTPQGSAPNGPAP